MTPLPSPAIYLHRTCRVCKAGLDEVLNLGDLRLNDFPATDAAREQIQRVPLVLCVCGGCGLAQLDRTVPPDWLYRTYWYKSGVNEMMQRELRDIVRMARSLVPLTAHDWVLDIGANDGTLLGYYRGWGERTDEQPRRTAVEPATNLQDRLRPHCEELIHDYFPNSGIRLHRAYKVITAIAMAYDLEDPLKFFQAMREILHPQGVALVQFQDFGQQLVSTAFDNICHEHLEYYTLHSLMAIVQRAGLQVVDVHRTAINGGSLRVVLRHWGDRWSVDPRVREQLDAERLQGLDTSTLKIGRIAAFTGFAQRVARAKEQILSSLQPALAGGQVVDVYGASTKGNILLQLLELGPAQIRQAIDRSPEKVGFQTITGIPIVGEEAAKVDAADLWLVPIWQFKASALEREAWYLQQGGRMIFPLPQVEIVSESWAPFVDVDPEILR